MSLSADLISQFVKATKDDKKTKSETTVYGTVVEYAGSNYVKFDGSDLLTPVETTVDAEPGDRVTVLLKDHTATVTGNVSSPAARTAAVQLVVNNVTELETVLADFISTEELAVESARIDSLDAENANIKQMLTVHDADITQLQADVVTVNETLIAHDASIETLEAEVARIDELVVTDADITQLQADVARIDEALVDKLSATDIEGKYANIDFSNISKATMGEFYANSGLIQNVVVGDATITGNLVGVTISGDLIEANTLIADKLVIQGEDGLYYALNTDGATVEAEQTDYNSLNGSVIKAQSITATKINVDDLVAFDATIGGFNITESSLYSGVKETVNNTTRGVYLDNGGQIAFGDASRYVKYYQDTDDSYKLEIVADSIVFGSENTNIETAIANAVAVGGRNLITNYDGFYFSGSGITLVHSGEPFNAYEESVNSGGGLTATIESNAAYSGNVEKQSTVTEISDTENGLFFANLKNYITESGMYTFSFYAKADMEIDFHWAGINHATCTSRNSDETTTLTTEYSQFITTVNVTEENLGESNLNVHWNVGSNSDLLPFVISYHSIKLEKGSTATDWTAAPEDTDLAIFAAQETADNAQADADALALRMTTAETNIQQNSDAIALLATKTEVTETLTGYYTKEESDAALTVTADEIESTVATTYATKTALAATDANVSAAQNTANTAITNAATAQTSADNAQADVDALTTRVSSAETSISQNADAIALSATKTEMNETLGDYYTKEEADANLTVTANAITSSVSTTYATKTALAATDANVTAAQTAADNAQADIDNLEVGGRNLLYDSKGPYSNESTTGSYGFWYIAKDTYIHGVSLEADQEYVLSFDWEVDWGTCELFTASVGVGLGKIAGQYTADIVHAIAIDGCDETNTKGRFSLVFSTTEAALAERPYFAMRPVRCGSETGLDGSTWIISNLKLEKGNTATDWTPAPEDVDADISALDVRVTDAETQIVQNTEAITLCATKTEVSSTLSGYYTKEESDAALTVTADEIASSVSNTYATKSSLATTQSELDSLESRVSTAETSITQNSNAIALRATKTELETAKSEAISTASSDATTKANNALSSANANTTSLLASYSTTAEMNAAIELESDNITSSVSSTYATKTALATTDSNVAAVQDDIDALSEDVSTNYATKSEVTQTVNSITSSVSSTYATKTALATTDSNVTAAQNAADAAQADIDGLTIGGRNLLKDTSDEFKELSMTEDKYYTQFGTDLVLEAGQTYTFSVYVEKTSEDDHTINLTMGCGNQGNYNKDLYYWRKTNITMGEKTSITYTVTESDISTYAYFAWRLRNELKATSVRFKEVKLEKGSRATDWTPCPDDTKADIAALDTRVTSAESSITILANSINSNVTETTNLGTRMTSVEQTASGLTTRLTSVESEVDDAAKTATNFANLSDDGLVVANLTNDTLGKNVLIGSDAVTVRTGTTENAVFGGDVIELAKNNESATISMLNGQFKIYYDSDNSDGGFGVYGKTADGQERLAFQPVNEIGNLTLGWGGYDTGENKTNLYGNEINMFAKTGINIYPGEGQFIETSGNVYLPNGRNIFTSNADGDKRSALIMNDSNQLFYGYGSYANGEGDVYYDGNTVNIRSKSSVNINGREYGENQILWSGGSYMSGSQTVTLSANISDQPNGIVIIFSRYASGAAQNYQFSTHFIPKSQVTSHNGGGHSFLIASDPIFSVIACKYLYISDDQITGHADNTATGTGTSGITYTNNAFVMRYVIGV